MKLFYLVVRQDMERKANISYTNLVSNPTSGQSLPLLKSLRKLLQYFHSKSKV
jgi:hypothetical protein